MKELASKLESDALEEHNDKIRSLINAPKREKAEQLSKMPVQLTEYRNERNLMLYPFCSTSKGKRLKTIEYKSIDGKRWLEVTANHKYGMAKIWDFDILRYAISKAGEIARTTGYFPETVEFSGYECLKAIGKRDAGPNYKWIKDGLQRLTSTTYCGNVFDTKETIISTLISAHYIDGSGKMERITIRFNNLLLCSARLRGLLVIDKTVLMEKSGIKKRILELVKTSMGNSVAWVVGVEQLQKMCAHEARLKDFKYELKSYSLPWRMWFSERIGGGENVHFEQKTTV